MWQLTQQEAQLQLCLRHANPGDGIFHCLLKELQRALARGLLTSCQCPGRCQVFSPLAFCYPHPCCCASGCSFHVWLLKLCWLLALTAGCQLRACPNSPSLREDCRGNTGNVVSPAIAGCSQCFNEVLEVKCHFNLLIALKGQQIALYHVFLICKLIKEYRGAFKWGVAVLLVCIRILAGTAAPLFLPLKRQWMQLWECS